MTFFSVKSVLNLFNIMKVICFFSNDFRSPWISALGPGPALCLICMPLFTPLLSHSNSLTFCQQLLCVKKERKKKGFAGSTLFKGQSSIRSIFGDKLLFEDTCLAYTQVPLTGYVGQLLYYLMPLWLLEVEISCL